MASYVLIQFLYGMYAACVFFFFRFFRLYFTLCSVIAIWDETTTASSHDLFDFMCDCLCFVYANSACMRLYVIEWIAMRASNRTHFFLAHTYSHTHTRARTRTRTHDSKMYITLNLFMAWQIENEQTNRILVLWPEKCVAIMHKERPRRRAKQRKKKEEISIIYNSERNSFEYLREMIYLHFPSFLK